MKVRNGKRSYRAEGLVVDCIGSQKYRFVFCSTGPQLFTPICISQVNSGIWAVRLNDEEKFLPNKTITRSEVVDWFRSAGFKVTRIIAPKKIRIVCS